jgi:cobalt-zinc-cadmium efflux system outer membrane protein
MLMFSINLPVWRESYKAAERQAKSIVLKTQQHRTQAENTLIAQAEQTLYDFEDSNRRIKLYGNILLPKAEELLQASETAYQAGTIDFLSLIDAQRMLLEFQLEYERAVTDNQQKLAELEMLVGAKLSATVEKPPAE